MTPECIEINNLPSQLSHMRGNILCVYSGYTVTLLTSNFAFTIEKGIRGTINGILKIVNEKKAYLIF